MADEIKSAAEDDAGAPADPESASAEAAAPEDSPGVEESAPPEPKVLGEDLARCLAPLEGEDPLGESPRYDETFIDLKSEVENIASGRVEWKTVKSLAIEVLATKAKDLYSASYLTAALIQLDGYGGLSDGLAILRHLIENQWEGVHPRKPPRSRAFALDWLVTRVHSYVEARDPKGEEAYYLHPCLDDVSVIAELAGEKLEHLAPHFSDLTGALMAKIAEFKPPEPEPPAPPPAEEKAAAPETASGQPPSEVSAEARSPASAPASALATASTGSAATLPPAEVLPIGASGLEIRNRVRSLVAPLRQNDPLSPMPYRLLRSLKWDDLPGSPPTEGGSSKTRILAPRSQQRSALENLHSAGQWSDLLQASEGAFQEGQGTFWLDLQLYTSTALEHLDPGRGARAAKVVREELAGLLERFGGLPQLTFADGSPFAAAPTRQWIDGSVRPMEIPASGGGRAEDMVLTAEEIEEARQLFAANKSAEALEVLQSGASRATQWRSQFHTRLTTAQLCLQGQRVEWARTILEELSREIESIRFEQWEPESAVEVYQLLGLCLGRQLRAAESVEEGEKPDEARRAALKSALDDLRSKLFRLDLRAVARIDRALEG